jgi:hypothetical protein
MTSILDRLTDAMSAAAGTVRDEELRPLVTPPRGRRRRRRPAGGRWRQWPWAAPVAAAAAVALVISLAVSVSNGLFGTQRPAGPAHLPTAPRQFSPLIQNVSFGWLPAGESLIQGGVRRTEVYLAAGRPPNDDNWDLDVYARGQCHLTGRAFVQFPNGPVRAIPRIPPSARGLKCSTQALLPFSGRAPAVRGHSAFWAGPGPNLVWQYARGGWAELQIPLPDLSALRHDTVTQRETIKIAGHLRLGAAQPLLFPAQFTGLTSQWRIRDVHYWADSGVLRADSYVLTTGTSRFFPHVGDLGVWANAPYVQIGPAIRASTCTPHDPATKNTSEIINGYRVVVKRMTAGGLPEQELCAAHADGLQLSITEFGPHPTIGVASLFKHLRLLGTNPANWTNNPIG